MLDNPAGAKIVGMVLVEVSSPHDHADLASMSAAHASFAELGLLVVAEREAAVRGEQGDSTPSGGKSR